MSSRRRNIKRWWVSSSGKGRQKFKAKNTRVSMKTVRKAVNRPRSGRKTIAQRFVAGKGYFQEFQSAKRTTEAGRGFGSHKPPFSRPLHGLTGFQNYLAPSTEVLGYCHSSAARTYTETPAVLV